MNMSAYFIVALTALFINIPLGYIREGSRKFSLAWFFWIHASIPFLIYLRISLKVSPWFIPAAIALAVTGQILGSRYRRQRTPPKTAKYREGLNILQKEKIDDSDVAIVLMNMGGPKTNQDVTEFQRNLFLDPILIRFPLSFLLQRLFAWLLVTLRANVSKERYRKIGGGSPIYESTERQMQALKNELKKRGRNPAISYSFNYSPPFPKDAIAELKNSNKKYILPLSLYPHYSKATTGSNLIYLQKEAAQALPGLVFLKVPSYYMHDGYIRAFVDRISETLKAGESLDDFYIVFSAHGLPKYFLADDDPYPFQVAQTVAKILGMLKRSENWTISYQSAVGPMEWLQPSTDDVIKMLAGLGIKKLLIVPVSFVGDHIETLCEIDIEYREFAEKLGIRDYRMSKAIESHPGFIEALADTVESVLEKPQAKGKQGFNLEFAVKS